MNKNRNNIRDTIENQDSISYKNPILAYIWILLGIHSLENMEGKEPMNLPLQGIHTSPNPGKNSQSHTRNSQK